MNTPTQGTVRPESSQTTNYPHLCACDIYGKIALLALHGYKPSEFRDVSDMSPARCRSVIRSLIPHVPDDTRQHVMHLLSIVDDESKKTVPRKLQLKELYYTAHRCVAMHLTKAKENHEIT